MTSDQLHRLLLDNLNTAVLLVDQDLLIDYINPAAEALLQVGNVRLRGIAACELFNDSETARQTLRESIEYGNPHTIRHEFLSGPVESSQVDYTVTPISIDSGQWILMEMQPVDRILRINREEALLSVHNTSRSLIRGLAHEIKNPLGGIRGAAQLLADEISESSMDDETAELCRIITTETDRLRNLVDRLLGPSQLPSFEKLNIHEVTEHVAALIEAEVQGKLVVTRDYDPSIPDLSGDRSQLVQAILNVTRNAMQAILEGSSEERRLTLKSRIQRSFTIAGEHHKTICRLDIIDTGPGISNDIKERIFFPMISGRSAGTGLGLTIAQSAINVHQGIIECESEPGHTCFSIYLPIKA
ncbi:MAG: nitrogen regulation protein NR(II) [Porticoccaceae bacterium]|nr:nitrogen regulation protein NR(II) [Porticoccaceae bacterium]